MKRLLLFTAVALVMTTAGAQMKNSTTHSRAAVIKEKLAKHDRLITPRQVDISKISTMKEMQARDFNATVSLPNPAPKRGVLYPSYIRPAGMFCSPFCNYGSYFGTYSDANGSHNQFIFLAAKPFADYTWRGYADAAGSTTSYAWDFSMNGDKHYLDGPTQVTFSTAFSLDTIPVFHAVDGRLDTYATWYSYQLRHTIRNNSSSEVVGAEPFRLMSATDAWTASQMLGTEDIIPLYSSKTFFCSEDESGKYLLTYYSGAQPWGNNDLGWWFGKNAQHIDGIAQAFEKPEHPYKIDDIYMLTTNLSVTANVNMTCKVYKLDAIPAYKENESVTLPEELGELIAEGRALLTPDLPNEMDGQITFTLYGEDDGHEYELHPTIDYPILVVIDGYNDPAMDNLTDFSAFISSQVYVDEGYGELAYLKYGETDHDGNFTGDYVWMGLNNFFSSGTMMSGFSIFLDIENNFITFDNDLENGEYLFPNSGGVLKKTMPNGDICNGIQLLCSLEDANDVTVTCNGDVDIPNWLTIDVTSQSGNSEMPYVFLANVVAAPLPSGLAYREATVRFEIPGDYVEYIFMQGEKPVAMRGDVNGDSKVNISDVTALINLLLSNTATVTDVTDVDQDGRVNVSDVTRLINALLRSENLNPVKFEDQTFTVNGVSFNMIAVEGGSFIMGATRDQGSNPRSNEKPIHWVTLSDYYIGQTEVTQALWKAVMGSNPSNFTGDLSRPVEMVTWNECQTFITQLNQLTGKQFRMLTEAEWEFAARGGNKNRGNMYAGSNNIGEVAWYSGNAGGTTHPVATKAPNELGIFDMSGNIYEYCQDGNYSYQSEAQTNPVGVGSDNESCTIRGGSMDYGADYSRNSYRWTDLKTSRWKDQGLRLAL